MLVVNNELRLGERFRSKSVEEAYRARNVTWKKSEILIGGGRKRTTWKLYVMASPINNHTRVTCFYGNKISIQARLVVVEGKCL